MRRSRPYPVGVQVHQPHIVRHPEVRLVEEEAGGNSYDVGGGRQEQLNKKNIVRFPKFNMNKCKSGKGTGEIRNVSASEEEHMRISSYLFCRGHTGRQQRDDGKHIFQGIDH